MGSCATCRGLSRTVSQANKGWMIPATASSGGSLTDAFPDITGEVQGLKNPPIPGGYYGIRSTQITNNPVQSPYGPNITTGFVPPPKSDRRFAYGLSQTGRGAIYPNPWKGYNTRYGAGQLRGVPDSVWNAGRPRDRPFTRRHNVTDDGGDAGGVGSGAGYGLTTGWPKKPQSNFNPYARLKRKQGYGVGTAFWSNDIAGDALNMQKAFGMAPNRARPFARTLRSETTAGLEGAAIGAVIGSLILGPLIWTSLGRRIVKKQAGKVYSHAHSRAEKYA